MTAADPLRGYQRAFVDRWMGQPRIGNAQEMGLGKTRAILVGIRQLFDIEKWLVVAPKRVAEGVWRQEAAKWGDVPPGEMRLLTAADFDMWRPMPPTEVRGDPRLRMAAASLAPPPGPYEWTDPVVGGTWSAGDLGVRPTWRPTGAPKDWAPGEMTFRDKKAARARLRALQAQFRVLVVSWDWVFWLAVLLGDNPGFGGVVLDESGYARNRESKRFQAARRLTAAAHYVVAANGTPLVNHFEEVWAQSFLLDRGETFGETLKVFRPRFLSPAEYGQGGAVTRWGLPSPEQRKKFDEAFAKLWMPMRTDDWLELPPLVVVDEVVEMPSHARALADDYLHKVLVEIGERKQLVANAGVGLGKALQVCNGAVYLQDEGEESGRSWEHFHDAKLDALERLLESSDGGVLVLYQFRHDLARIRGRLVGESVADIGDKYALARFEAGEVRVLLAHPRSVGHGLNLQHAGHTTIWFGLSWDLELYLQANARMRRHGQRAERVVIHRIVTNHPAERAVMRSLDGKASLLDALMDSGKELDGTA